MHGIRMHRVVFPGKTGVKQLSPGDAFGQDASADPSSEAPPLPLSPEAKPPPASPPAQNDASPRAETALEASARPAPATLLETQEPRQASGWAPSPTLPALLLGASRPRPPSRASVPRSEDGPCNHSAQGAAEEVRPGFRVEGRAPIQQVPELEQIR